jgi:hypothetical protein
LLESNPRGVAVNGSTGSLYTSRLSTENVEVWGSGAAHPVTVTPTGSGEVSQTGGSEAVSGSITNCREASGTCLAEYFQGQGPQLTATADANNELETWTVEHAASTTCTGSTSPCTIEVGTEDVSAKAEFALSGFELKVEKEGTGTGTVESDVAGAGSNKIECGSTCSELFAPATAVVLTASTQASDHSEFSGWGAGDCEEEPTPSECKVTMSAAKTVHATFTHLTRKLTVIPHGTGTISAVPPPAPVSGGPISACQEGGPASDCEATYDSGVTVELEATPAPHKEIVWTGCTTPSGNTCEIDIPDGSDVTVESSEVAITHTLTVVSAGEGKVSASPGPISNCSESAGTCSGSYAENGAVTLTATPEPGWEFSGWGVGECETETGPAGSECHFLMPESAKTAHATFVAIGKVLLSRSTTGTGTGEIKCNEGACASEYDEGEIVNLKAVPTGGHSSFNGWSVTGSGSVTTPCAGATNPCEVKMEPPGPVSVAASFGAITVTGVSPGEGPEAGGNSVEITGTNLGSATKVEFGATPVASGSFTENTSTKIKLPAPPGSAGTVNVIVTTGEGASSNTAADDYTYRALPTLTGCTPNEGKLAAGESVTCTGTNLVAGATAFSFGANPATSVVVNGAGTSATMSAPAGAAGPVNVTATTAGGTSGPVTYTYRALPTLTGCTPNEGKLAAGESVTCTGTNLVTGATTFSFGANPATSVVVNGAGTSATMSAPAGAAGPVNVTATTAGGTSGPVTYTYRALPTISSIAPNEGPSAGGQLVTITGTHLEGATKVEFGVTPVACDGTLAHCKVESDTQIKVTTPAGALGSVNVRVVSPGGTSLGSPYKFVAAPTVSAVSPGKGPTAGGTSVTIGGSGFVGVTAVKFGAAGASAFTVNSPTQITATAPPAAAGQADVTVLTPGGTSATSAADQFTYVAPLALAVTKSGTGSGSVSCDGGPCAATYAYGATVSLAAAPDSGSSFSGWSGAGCSGTAGCVVTVIADTAVTASFDMQAIPPPPVQCVVPKLKGLSLGKAKSALAKANCALGKVTKPKPKKGKKTGPLVVQSSNPGAGSTHPEGTKVSLKLGPKPKKKNKRAGGH